ncbi:MAG: hypothetical protein ACYDBQ_10645 [Thermoplasmatota archaeon]
MRSAIVSDILANANRVCDIYLLAGQPDGIRPGSSMMLPARFDSWNLLADRLHGTGPGTREVLDLSRVIQEQREKAARPDNKYLPNQHDLWYVAVPDPQGRGWAAGQALGHWGFFQLPGWLEVVKRYGSLEQRRLADAIVLPRPVKSWEKGFPLGLSPEDIAANRRAREANMRLRLPN